MMQYKVLCHFFRSCIHEVVAFGLIVSVLSIQMLGGGALGLAYCLIFFSLV